MSRSREVTSCVSIIWGWLQVVCPSTDKSTIVLLKLIYYYYLSRSTGTVCWLFLFSIYLAVSVYTCFFISYSYISN